jgi:hypothetical protein
MDLAIYIIILISATAMAILPLIKDVFNRSIPKKNFFKKLTWSGKWLLVAAAITIGFSIWKQIRDNKQQEKDRNDYKEEVAALRTELDSANYDPADMVENGISVSGILTVNDVLEKRRKFIFDTGEKDDKNRMSMYLDVDNNLVFRIIDNNGEVFSVEAPQTFLTFKMNAIYFVCCDAGISNKFSYMRIFLDDKEIARQEFHAPIYLLTRNMSNIIIGADMNKQNNGKFTMASISMGKNLKRKEIMFEMNDLVNLLQSVWGDKKDSDKNNPKPNEKSDKKNLK